MKGKNKSEKKFLYNLNRYFILRHSVAERINNNK